MTAYAVVSRACEWILVQEHPDKSAADFADIVEQDGDLVSEREHVE